MRLTTEDGKIIDGISKKDIAEKLSKYENMYDALIAEHEKVTADMEKLKLAGKTKSVTYNQLFASKLTLNNIIGRFEIYVGK